MKRVYASPYFFPILIALITSFFSTGFFHPDEHFQILEYLNFKRGGISDADLSWEYASGMRPFTQVFYYFVIGKISSFFSNNPFFEASLFRLATGLIGLVALIKLTRLMELERRETHFVAFFFFVPFFLFRTSSESLSAGLMFWALLFILEKRVPFLIGVLLVFSGHVRMPMLVPGFSLALWTLYEERGERTFQLKLLLGGLFAILLVLLIDYWGYGKVTLVWWNYINENIILGKSKEFGVSPWWSYFPVILIKGIFPFSLILMLSTLFFWWKKKLSPLTIATLSFFLVHLFIAHKEFRFLTFIYLLSPIFLLYTLKELAWKIPAGISKALMGLNFILLLFFSFRSAYRPIGFYQYAYENLEGEIAVLPDHKGEYLSLLMKYYVNGKVELRPIKNEELSTISGYVLSGSFEEYNRLKADTHCLRVYGDDPSRYLTVNFSNWVSRSAWWTLWRCDGSLK